ncbi:MAG: TolC family protein, partial [Nitrospirae bacterium]|nr:TolC family protein [Nitrospirota bacterium]
MRAQFRPRLDLGLDAGLVYGEPTGAFFLARGIPSTKIDFFGRFYTVDLTLSYSLLKEGALMGIHAPSLLQRESEVKEADYAEQEIRERIISDVSNAYYSALKNMEEVRAAEDLHRSRQLDHQTAQKKFEQDLIAKHDLLQAEVHLAESEKDRNEAQDALLLSLADLAVKIGLEPTEEISLVSSSDPMEPLPSVKDLIEISYKVRPEIAIAQTRVQSGRAGIDLARGERLPTIDFTSSYTMGDDLNPPINASWITGFQLKMPLFDFGAVRARVSKAAANAAEREKDLIQVRHTVGLEVIQAYTAVRD